MAGSWLIASVCIDLTKQSSSTTFAVCGINSLTQAPPRPCRADGGGKLAAAQVAEFRFVVEQVQLRRGAGLEEVNDALGPWLEVRQVREAAGADDSLLRRRCEFSTKEPGQGSQTNGRAGAAEEM